MWNGTHPAYIGRPGYLGPGGVLGPFPFDDVTDPHAELSAQLSAGEHDGVEGFSDYLSSLGHSGAWTRESGTYAIFHAGPGGRSLMAHILGYLVARGAVGSVPEPTPPSDDTYPGQMTFDATWRRLMEFGLVIGTTPNGSITADILNEEAEAGDPSNHSKAWYVARYWQNQLTPENDAALLFASFGRWILPESVEIGPEVSGLYAAVERSIAEWGLAVALGGSNAEALRQAAGAAYDSFERSVVPGPGTPSQPVIAGASFANPRYVINRGRMVESWIRMSAVHGGPSAFNAAMKCQGLARLVGERSRYDAYAMQTQPLYENDWRAVLGLPIISGGSGGGFGIGGNR